MRSGLRSDLRLELDPVAEKWARVDLVKHRPLRGRCFTELAPGTGARLNYRGDVPVREVGSEIGSEAGVGSGG